jgi:bifunctional non-homologous end joining protein LigD
MFAFHHPHPRDLAFWRRARRFVVKEHHASRLHWDFRLEWEGVLKSWVLERGPSQDPRLRQHAEQVHDHSLKWLLREGTIPPGHYGAGELYLWDWGMYVLHASHPRQAWQRGELLFTCYGTRLRGDWRLLRSAGASQWQLQKLNDQYAELGHSAEVMGTGYPRKAAAAGSQLVLPYAEATSASLAW